MYKIINKDILDGLNEVPQASIDLIFIDPPYNLKKQYADNITDSWSNESEYLKWLFLWLDIALKKTKTIRFIIYNEHHAKHALYRHTPTTINAHTI